MRINLLASCSNCPFLREEGIRLTRGRIVEIAGGMLQHGAGSTFPCHKTVRNGGRQQRRDKWRHCAGALIFAVKNGCETQMMQVAQRLGLFDPGQLQGHADVFDSIDEMLGTAVR